MNRKFLAFPTLAWLLFTLAGCALPGALRFSRNDFPKTGPKNPVVRILGLWQPSQGMWEGRTTRGFSGQVMFFGTTSDAPASVNGEVMIYVFDDQGEAEDQAKPIHEFKFPADSWNALLADGPLGATYGVFIPYTRPGIHAANCTLRVRYIPAAGHPLPVYSEMVNIPLVGTKKPKSAAAGENDEGPVGVLPNHESNNGSNPPEVSDRTPPRARGMSEPIPAQNDLQKLLARKPQAVELTEAERQRILREVKGRLKSGDAAGVLLVGHEEAEAEHPVTRRNRSARRARNPLGAAASSAENADDEDSPPMDESQSASAADATIDDREDAENDNDSTPYPANRSAERKLRRPLIDLESENDGKRKRHPLDD